MSDIHFLANRVVAWIGPASPLTKSGISALMQYGMQVEMSRDLYRVYRPGCENPDWYRIATPLPYSPEIWDSVWDILSRPWFDRLWILQEIQLDSDRSIILCGEGEIPWSLFRRAANSLFAKIRGVPERIRKRIVSGIAHISDYLLEQSTHELLLYHANRKCSNDRDRIYGLLSLLPEATARSSKVDYTMPMADISQSLLGQG